tara:strand:- start:3226 stop:4179 length:954 start_codon:yes stop_codon:yes gene_type:complete
MIRLFIATMFISFIAVSILKAAEINPESAKIAKDVPIADLHLHPDPQFPAVDVIKWMDRNGVRWAGAGAKRGRRKPWEQYAAHFGNRFIAFGGQSELNIIYLKQGIKAMHDAENADIKRLFTAAESDLKAGRINGIGEIFANNNTRRGKFGRKGKTDSAAMRLFFNLVAQYDGFLTIHMNEDHDSVEQLQALVASNRKGRVLWNHCGSSSEAESIGRLLKNNPNLYCEISFRYPPVLNPNWRNYSDRKIFDEDGVEEDWLKLIEELPDRFLVGTDSHNEEEYDGAIKTVRSGLLPYLRPATAKMVAFENAKKLFDLK